MKISKKIVLVLIVGLIYAIANGFSIYKYSYCDEKRESDVAIILGASVDSKGVSPVYEERINHGIWLCNNGYVKYIILTGGKGRGNDFSDASKAKEYALSKGISENKILLEEKSAITQDNLKYSKDIMDEIGLDSCIIVSDPLHMKRAMLMAEEYEMNACSSPTPTTRYHTWKTKFPFLLRELFFYIGYKNYYIIN